MTLPSPRQQRGFTIIEVMIVLAIAGLIFGIIFLAVPALNRNKRNMARKSDVARLISLVEEYRVHNAQIGSAPFQGPSEGSAQAEFDAFRAKYLGREYDSYTFDKRPGVSNDNNINPGVNEIVYYPQHACKDGAGGPPNTTVQSANSDKIYAVLVGVEDSGSVCIDNA